MAIAKDFGFIGRLCLDFAHTGDMGYGTRFERLTTPAELGRWLQLSPLRLPRIRVSLQELKSARMLRSAIWRVVGTVVRRTVPAAGDVRLINRMARQPGLTRELELGAKSMCWHQPTAARALATIAQDAVMQLGDPTQHKRIRRCENSGCKVVFYDDSRPGLRRWCASNRCGDRVRARLYRKRHKTKGV
jgi:predicted RNA-binding Zn ribbon-like protein